MFSKLLVSLRSALVCTSLLVGTTCLAQTTINVGPGQAYATIQAGINAAVNGDTVLVAPGTYYENIDFRGKAITVTSSGGAAVTTIDGGYKPGLATVTFAKQETSASVLSKFTVTGGGDAVIGGTSDGGVYVGGDTGYIVTAWPTIENNIITANYCHNVDVQFATPTLVNNEISNTLQSSQGLSYCDFRSGIHLGGTANYSAVKGTTISGNIIENNLTGSGINLWAAQNVLMVSNIIRGNVSSDPGSAFVSANSNGTVLFQNLIYGNTSNCGGALAFQNGGLSADLPQILIANNTIVNNVTPRTNSGSECISISQLYPAPYSYGSSGPGSVVVNNILSGSTSYPAVNCDWFGMPSESNQPTFKNNIFDNAGGPVFGSYCIDVSSKYDNVIANPQFVSPSTGDYHLRSTSPAIDSGDNDVLKTFLAMTGETASTDFDGHARVQAVNSTVCTIDRGAYEYSGVQSACSTSEILTSSLNPSFFGQTVTLTAQLTSTNGVPTGAVQFSDGSTILGTQAVTSAGVAAFSTGVLAIGSHAITATYQPSGVFAATRAALTQVVNGFATTTGLTCSPLSIPLAGTALLAASVNSISGTPTGSIAFTDNGLALATQPLLSGGASYSYTGLVAGTHTLTATYTPSGSFSGSSASCFETVTALPTTSVLTVTPAASAYGAPVTLMATVSPAMPPGSSVPTGTVTFYSGTASLGAVVLAGGVASLSVSTLAVGVDTLSCVYGGSSIYSGSSCNPVPVTVSAVPTSLTLSSSINPAPALSPVTFTARLSVNGQPAGAGNAIALSLNGQTASLVTDAAGAASYTIGTLTPGSYPVAASVAGSGSYLASAAMLTEVVTAIATGTSLTVSPNPAYFGQAVTMVATVSAAVVGQVAAGSVSFFDGGVLLGMQPLTSGGSSTFSTSSLAVGTHPVTAAFSPANATFGGSTSSPVVNEVILASGFTIGLTPGSITLAPGATGAVAIQLGSVGGFAGPLTLSYGTLPAYETAALRPATVSLTAGGTGASSLTLTTLLKAMNHLPVRPGSRMLPGVFAALLLGLIPLRRLRRRGLARLLGLAFAVVGMQALGGCANDWYTAHSVAPGTYQLPVTATDVNHNSQTATLTVVVTP